MFIQPLPHDSPREMTVPPSPQVSPGECRVANPYNHCHLPSSIIPSQVDNESVKTDILIVGTPCYVATLPASARPHLELQLDWGHGGVETDLCEIAHVMLDWEERLCTHLGLTEVDVHDIKAMHFGNPPLQR